jgi:hypothetical protein
MRRQSARFSIDTLVILLLCVSVLTAGIIKLRSQHERIINPLAVEIPEVLQKHYDAVVFIRQSTSAINHWSELFNQILKEQIDLNENKNSTTIYQKVRLLNLTDRFLTGQDQFTMVCEEIDERAMSLAMNMQDEEKEALFEFVDKIRTQKQLIIQLCNPQNIITGEIR